MTVMLPQIATAIPTPSAELLRDLIARGPSAAAVAPLLSSGGEVTLCVERVHFPAEKPVQFHIRVTGPAGSELLIGEWLGPDAIGVAAVESMRLAKPRRGQNEPDRVSVLSDPETGLVLRRAGFDAKLAGLRMLYDPAFAEDRLRVLGVSTHRPRLALVGHRLGKRAVIRVSQSRQTWYLRLRATTSESGEVAHARHQALWLALQGESRISIPRPLEFDPISGAAMYQALPGRAPDFAGLTGFRDTAAIMRALAGLQMLKIDAPNHTVADELAILSAWADRLRMTFPELSRKAGPILSRLRRDMSALASLPPVPCHRDLHEGQILITGRGSATHAGVLDFDTLRLGDPALDAGNLQAHLVLAGLRDGRSRAAFISEIERCLSHLPTGHLAVWRRAALLRLAMIYAFSAEPRAVILGLLAEAKA